tara:strand:+ start:707 stop:1195 length:489 start_codon:yes stop_codon:yes gene_type:complete
MAVPGSGTLTLEGIAQERLYGTYGSGLVSQQITMTDLINGGGPNPFPALNTSSPSVPSVSKPWPMSDWYNYEQNASGPGCNIVFLGFDPFDPVVACENTAEPNYFSGAGNPGVIFNFSLYDDPGCTNFAPFGWYANPAVNERAQWSIQRGQQFPSWSNIQPC